MGHDDGSLDGAVVLVTGAARGQGRTHCLRLAAEGAAVIATDICAPVPDVGYPMASHEDLAETTRQVVAAGGQVSSHVVDVRDPTGMAAAVTSGVTTFGHLDGVIANAGICAVGPADVFSPALFQSIIDINLVGVWNTCVAAIPHLRTNGGGSMVLVSSSSGLKGLPYFSAYSAAKHGLVGLMQSLGLELARDLIRVNTVHPTGVDTEMTRGLGALGALIADHPEVGPLFVNALPVATVSPDEVSNAVLFLLSRSARSITGLTMTVDAGMALR